MTRQTDSPFPIDPPPVFLPKDLKKKDEYARASERLENEHYLSDSPAGPQLLLVIALKALPEHWEVAHGYRPLLAETFTDC